MPKKISTTAKSLVEKFGEEGLLTRKVVMMFNEGDQTFTSTDCWNNLRDVRGKKLDVGDALTVLNYCQNNKLKTPISFMQFNVMMLAIRLIFLGECAIKNGLSILWGCSDI